MRTPIIAAFALGAAMVAGPVLAQPKVVTFCKAELESVLSLHDLKLEDMSALDQVKVGYKQPSVVSVMTPPGCDNGELRVSMWYTCSLQSITTIGECEVKGVKKAPF